MKSIYLPILPFIYRFDLVQNQDKVLDMWMRSPVGEMP